MRWRTAKRLAWLAAWTGWAFLAWRLYVELPRTLGEPTTVRIDGECLRFELDDGSGFVNFADVEAGETGVVEVRDYPHGAVRKTFEIVWPGPSRDTILSREFLVSVRRGSDIGSAPALALDLRTGRATSLAAASHEFRGVGHGDRRAYAALWTRLPRDVGLPKEAADLRRVVVIDLATGARVCCLPPENQPLTADSSYDWPQFLPGTDLVAVHHASRAPVLGAPSLDYEVWRVPFGAAPTTRFAESPEHWFAGGDFVNVAFSTTGCVAIQDGLTPHALTICDLASGKMLLQEPRPVPKDGAGRDFTGERLLPVFSEDGRYLLDQLHERIIEVGTGNVTFRFPEDIHWIRPSMARGLVELNTYWNMVPLAVRWNEWIGKAFPALVVDGSLYTVFDARTGAVVYRCNAASLHANRHWIEPAEGGVSIYGPPMVRWGWWSAAMAILALPLAAIWLIGRWCRQRR